MIGQSWREEQLSTQYPFSDGATLTADTAQTIARDTFLDAAVCLVGGVGPLYLSQIDVTAQGVTFWIGDVNERLAASGSYVFAAEVAVIELVDVAERPAGILVSEPTRLSRFAVWPDGRHSFDILSTEFVARATMCPPIQGVSAFRDNSEVPISGHVFLVGDEGVLLRLIDDKIRVDVVGDPLFKRRLCGADGSQLDRLFVKAFAGLRPNSKGEFVLTVNEHVDGSVLRIKSDTGGIDISMIGG